MSDATPAGLNLVLATPHARHDRLEASLRARGLQVTRVRTREDLSAERLKALAPTYVFLPHWSWLIPESVFAAYECVVFHMTELPFGRGGSPLQNLIVRGIYETRLSALRCVRELDAGPIYAQMPLSLHGGAEEILLRAAALIEDLIVDIVEKRPTPLPQVGEATLFRRRRPEDGDLAGLTQLSKVHDHIRMLDAEGYPPAFLRVGRLRLEFGRSRLSADHLLADVSITIVPDEETP
jgi:methionyl-tRNA formyltransferase